MGRRRASGGRRPPALAGAAVAAVLATGHSSHRPAAAAVLVAAVLTARRARSTGAAFVAVVERLAVAVVVLGCLAPHPVRWTLAATAVAAGWLAGAAMGRALPRARTPGERTVLVGDGADVARMAGTLASAGTAWRVVATATTDGSVPAPFPGGAVDALPALVATHRADHVLVCTPAAYRVIESLARDRLRHVRLSVVPPLAEVLTGSPEVLEVRGLPLVSIPAVRPAQGAGWIAKRAADRLVAIAALLALALPFAVIALVIRLESPGPAFFRQKRVGRHGRVFEMWKFRSMVFDAESLLPELLDLNEAEGPYFKLRNDPRVTRVGRWLRRFYLDELPQLINVVKGDMTLVGPRPILPSELADHPDVFGWRLPALPGMTGRWQVAGSSWLPVEEGMRLDHAYLRGWSVAGDARILGRTLSTVLRGQRRPSPALCDFGGGLDRTRYVRLTAGDELLPASTPVEVSVVVVTHDAADDIAGCLGSLARDAAAGTIEVIVVDNASQDGTADLVADRFPWARLVRKPGRHGFATNCNIGACAAAGEYLLFLNPDARLVAGSTATLVGHLRRHPAAGAAGPRLLYPDGRLQPSARLFPSWRATLLRRSPLRLLVRDSALERRHLALDGVAAGPADVDWLLGAAIMVPAATYVEVGGMDDRYRLYCEDIDLCWRLRQRGLQVHYVPGAVGVHALSETTRHRFLTRLTVWHVRSMLRFVRRNGLAALRAGRPPRPLPVAAESIGDGAPFAVASSAADIDLIDIREPGDPGLRRELQDQPAS